MAKTRIQLRGPDPGPEAWELIERANKGDQSCLPEIRALLADGDLGGRLAECVGSSAEWLRQSIAKESSGEGLFVREAVIQKLDNIRAELEGPSPTPIERLLAERASLCWFIVHWYENVYVNSEKWPIWQVDLQQRKIDKAHARFLSALRTLARVRKMALPSLRNGPETTSRFHTDWGTAR